MCGRAIFLKLSMPGRLHIRRLIGIGGVNPMADQIVAACDCAFRVSRLLTHFVITLIRVGLIRNYVLRTTVSQKKHRLQ